MKWKSIVDLVLHPIRPMQLTVVAVPSVCWWKLHDLPPTSKGGYWHYFWLVTVMCIIILIVSIVAEIREHYKYMKMRVIKSGEYFYPQKKGWFFWNFYLEKVKGDEDKTVKFTTTGAAIKFLLDQKLPVTPRLSTPEVVWENAEVFG